MPVKRKEGRPTQRKLTSPISYRLIREYKRIPVSESNPRNCHIFWVVQWSHQTKPQFEKRRVYLSTKGEIKPYKLSGITQEDLEYILSIADQIKADTTPDTEQSI